MFKRFSSAVFAALLLCTASAQANDYRVEFSASGFTDPYSNPGPFNEVSGYLVYSSTSAHWVWSELKEFSLTIGNHTYTPSDVDYLPGVVGGLERGAGTIWTDSKNDFSLTFPQNLMPGRGDFTYTTDATEGIYESGNLSFTVTSVPSAPVPEPEAYAMLLVGLGLVGVAARRRKA